LRFDTSERVTEGDGILRTVVALAAFAILGGSALADEMPYYRKAAAAVAPVPYSWTGFYGGLNIGYGFGGEDPIQGEQTHYANLNSLASQGTAYGGPAWNMRGDLNGVLGGGQFGYNLQSSPWLVLGVETDIQGSGLSSSKTSSVSTAVQLFPQPAGGWPGWPETGTAHTSQHVDWFGTLRGRIGITPFSPGVLLYGTGGLAYGGVSESFDYTGVFPAVPTWGFLGARASGTASASGVKVGWTAGAGVEWVPTYFPKWTAKVEYLYTDLGSTTLQLHGTGFGNDGSSGRVIDALNNVGTSWHTVRIGLNYHY
jgi:outer membrane immunogenic protein